MPTDPIEKHAHLVPCFVCREPSPAPVRRQNLCVAQTSTSAFRDTHCCRHFSVFGDTIAFATPPHISGLRANFAGSPAHCSYHRHCFPRYLSTHLLLRQHPPSSQKHKPVRN